MKQIAQSLSDGKQYALDLPIPSFKNKEVLIRTTFSLISSGTEKMLIDFGKSNLLEKAFKEPDRLKEVISKVKNDGLFPTFNAVDHKLNELIPLGYCNIGHVVEVGADVNGLKVGDRVVSNGFHAEYVSVPESLCIKIPDKVLDKDAIFTVPASIALQGVRLSQPTFGETFLVIGLGLIGLLAVKLLKANGCKVIGIDPDKYKCLKAKELGIETVNSQDISSQISEIKNMNNHKGIDGVLITASTKSNEPLDCSAEVCRKRGRIIMIGVTGMNIRRDLFYKKELTFQVSCSYGPGRYDKNYEEKGNDYPIGYVRWTQKRNFEAILSSIESGLLIFKDLVTHNYHFNQALKAYKILSSDEKYIGIVLNYDKKNKAEKKLFINADNAINVNNSLETNSISFIGSGNYANRILIPAFKVNGVKLDCLISNDGLKPCIYGRKFKFKSISTSKEEFFKNSKCQNVVITTRHNSHAELVKKCLLSGKNVFVEKPLCLNLKELEEIENIYKKIVSNKDKVPIFTVGFNRRFAPLILKLKELLSINSGEVSFNYSINAGYIPSENWVHDPKTGGGRLIGEACHFLDLLLFLSGSSIEKISSLSMKDIKIKPDTFVIQVKFKNGSIGTINYFSNGSRYIPKERLEVFKNKSIFVLDNFRSLKAYGCKGFNFKKTFVQDKGVKNLVKTFISSIETSKNPIPIEEIFSVHRNLLEIEQ
ncbi:MAG: bi-domain-containing oxidoreductase [Prochlorococcus marinus XMU1428]|nr:bi-domain-containing oxidoreductase [Prochlorococcus marinus XMU1428]